MAHQEKASEAQDGYNYYDNSLKHWRRYGSWFSWGSPVGLGLFCISAAVTLWILSQAFGWN